SQNQVVLPNLAASTRRSISKSFSAPLLGRFSVRLVGPANLSDSARPSRSTPRVRHVDGLPTRIGFREPEIACPRAPSRGLDWPEGSFAVHLGNVHLDPPL